MNACCHFTNSINTGILIEKRKVDISGIEDLRAYRITAVKKTTDGVTRE
jgi:hypothetical protein